MSTKEHTLDIPRRSRIIGPRPRTSTLTKIAGMVKTMRPIDVYTQLNKEEQMDHRPRDKRQVRNKKYEAAKAERMTGNGEGVVHQNNFADQIIQLTNLIRTDGFIHHTGSYTVKKKVFEAALLTAVLYSCESWLSRSLAHVQSLYMTLVKVLLGVRKTTPNNLCLIELGYPTVAGRIRTMQSKLVTKLIEERKNIDSDPLNYVWQLCYREGTRAAKYVREIQATSDHTADDVAMVKRRVVNSTGTKIFTYRTDINPSLDPHPVYTDIRAKVREHHRIFSTPFVSP